MPFCQICKIAFPDKESFKAHLGGKRHRTKIIQRKIDNRVQNSSLLVTDIPSDFNQQDLKSHFSNFGEVRLVETLPESNSAWVRFAQESAATSALQAVIIVNGHRLTVKRYNLPEEGRRNTGTFSIFASPIIEAVCGEVSSNVDETLLKLVRETQSSEEEGKHREEITKKLQSIFSQQLPGCELTLVGSALAGLSLTWTDLDLQIHVPDSSLTPSAILDQACFVLRSCPEFKSTVHLKKARVPVVKTVHRSTGVLCDLTYKNAFAVQNSLLLRHLTELDPRVRPLIILLRLWARTHGFTGGHAGPGRLSSYAFTLLTVYYLQQLDPPILPPVEELMRDVAPEERITYNGWDVSFDRAIDKYRKVGNEMTLLELIRGFFTLYGNLNLAEVVICPLLGKTLPRSVFTEACKETLPPGLSSYARVFDEGLDLKPLDVESSVVVQDPHELSYNTTHHYLDKFLQRFQEACKQCTELCQKMRDEQNFSELSRLFITPSEKEVEPPPSPEKQSINLNFIPSCEMELEQRYLYMTCVANAVEEVLDVALMILRPNAPGADRAPPAKRAKKVKDITESQRTFKLEIPYNVWHCRAKYLKIKPKLQNLPHLAKERVRTLLVGQDNPGDVDSVVSCVLAMTISAEPCAILLDFAYTGPPRVRSKFNAFMTGIKQNIGLLLEPLLAEMDLPLMLDSGN